jgi:hypothetical protein
MTRERYPTLTQRQHYDLANRKIRDMLRAFVEIQQGPNPLSRVDLEKLVARHPRYRILLGGSTR